MTRFIMTWKTATRSAKLACLSVVWMAIPSNLAPLLAQMAPPCDHASCDGACDSMGVPHEVHPCCRKSSNQGRGFGFGQRILDQFDRLGDALEAALPAGAKQCGCTSCSSCDQNPSCGLEEPPIRESWEAPPNPMPRVMSQSELGSETAKKPGANAAPNSGAGSKKNSNVPNAKGNSSKVPTPASPFEKDPPSKKKEGGMNVPASPSLPEDWKKDPFKDDARIPTPNRYKKNPTTLPGPNYNRAYDPQAFIAAQRKAEIAKIQAQSPAQGTKRSLSDTASNMQSIPEFRKNKANDADLPRDAARVANGVHRSLNDESPNRVMVAANVAPAINVAPQAGSSSDSNAANSNGSTKPKAKQTKSNPLKMRLTELPKLLPVPGHD